MPPKDFGMASLPGSVRNGNGEAEQQRSFAACFFFMIENHEKVCYNPINQYFSTGGTAMKLMIASDIHGSAYYCRKMLNAFDRERAERLLLLGDILYHGPRNDLPRDYAPKEVIGMLNPLREKLLCVRGNCDTEVDQMVLAFPILAEYCILYGGKQMVFATHGHNFNLQNLPPLQPGDILLHGHTHVPACQEEKGIWYLNPGSVSIPKEGSWNGYMTWDGKVFVWKDLDGTVKLTHSMEDGK